MYHIPCCIPAERMMMYYCVPELDEVEYDPAVLSGYMPHIHAAIAALNAGQADYRADGEVTFLYPTRRASITVTVEVGDSSPVSYWVIIWLASTESPQPIDVPGELGRVPLIVDNDL
ncbi:MAG TPA: hypothetical protein VFT59_05930 [Candidatus Saccharimonadales bacterium]|nr:hypothetical protein [Candidatus Saccharimonadales bacterium]